MKEIVILGAGNVAFHLFKAFQATEQIKVIQVYNRSSSALKDFEKETSVTTEISQLKPADLYIVSVSDDAVKEVVDSIAEKNTLIVHTSGSVPLLDSAQRNGVFYPLQTFSKNTDLNFFEIPLCLEASNKKDLDFLKDIGKTISNNIYEIDTAQRKSLHLAAVWACNFTNHLYRIAEKICEQKEVPFDILHALIKETARKVQHNSPKDVQTGPAKRGDKKTIDFHLNQLDSPELKEIYTLLTESIKKEHGSKL